MTLKKTIASYLGDDGYWTPQIDIDMHPLEEAVMRAHWTFHEELEKLPKKPSIEQEHEWLIESGSDYVKQKRNEHQKAYDTQIENVAKAEAKHKKACQDWASHCELCIASGHNPDTHPGF